MENRMMEADREVHGQKMGWSDTEEEYVNRTLYFK